MNDENCTQIQLIYCVPITFSISQTLTIAELSEHECQGLVPAGEALHITVPSIFANKIIEVISVEKRCQLCENEFVLEHMQSLILAAKLQNQVR